MKTVVSHLKFRLLQNNEMVGLKTLPEDELKVCDVRIKCTMSYGYFITCRSNNSLLPRWRHKILIWRCCNPVPPRLEFWWGEQLQNGKRVRREKSSEV